MSSPTIFSLLAQAAQSALAALPEVGGRVYMDLDAALAPESLPAVVLSLGDDESGEIDDDTLQVRLQLHVHILANALDAVGVIDPIEQAVHRRLAAGAVLQESLAGPLKRSMGTRRVLRETEGHPVMRRITYEARIFANAATLAPLS